MSGNRYEESHPAKDEKDEFRTSDLKQFPDVDVAAQAGRAWRGMIALPAPVAMQEEIRVIGEEQAALANAYIEVFERLGT